MELQVEQRICALDAEGAVKLLTFDTVQQDASEGKHTLYSAALDNVIADLQGGLFSLFYVNCQKPAVVSFDIQVGMYNIRGKTKDYLSVGEDALPTVYLVRPDCTTDALEHAMHVRECRTCLLLFCMHCQKLEVWYIETKWACTSCGGRQSTRMAEFFGQDAASNVYRQGFVSQSTCSGVLGSCV